LNTPERFKKYLYKVIIYLLMAFEGGEKGEQVKGGSPKSKQFMTLQKAVDMGEYDPEYLATFPEWFTLSRHVQFQFIKQGLDNRRRQLWLQWAEINNTPNFHLKPHLAIALTNVEKQIKKLDSDWEKFFVKYS